MYDKPEKPMRLSDEIVQKVNNIRLQDAFNKTTKEERVGALAFVFGDALADVNIIRHEESDQLYIFDGSRYVPILNKDVEFEVREAMLKVGVSMGIIVKNFKVMMTHVWMSVGANKFIPTKNLICFENCIFDARNGKTYDFSPEIHVVHKLPFAYDTHAEAPKWNKFLKEVLPERDCREALQMFLGLVFLDRSKVKAEYMMILLGSGSNGKSVVFETVNYILGSENVSTYELKSLISESSTSQYNLADVDGKMINYCTELDKKVIDSTKVKALVSGEPSSARYPYGRPFMARSLPIMMANANDYPKTNDHSPGFFRRFIYLPFDVKISAEKANKSLSYELQQEASGIFNWFFDGYKKIKEKKFIIDMPEKSKIALQTYRVDSNSVFTFMKSNQYSAKPIYNEEMPMLVQSSSLYKEYSLFCQANGFSCFSSTEFGKLMKNGEYEFIRNSKGVFYKLYHVPLPSEFKSLKKNGQFSGTFKDFSMACGYYDMVEAGEDVAVDVEPEINFEKTEDICPF